MYLTVIRNCCTLKSFILNKNFKYKQNAFTLMEMVVTILILGIVIYLTYSIILFLNLQMEYFRRDNEELSKVIVFSTVISRDFYESESLTESNESIILTGPNGDPIEYDLSDSKIIRLKNGNQEGFGIQLFNYIYKVELDENKRYHYLSLRTIYGNDTLQLDFSKKEILTDSLIKD